MARLIDSFIAYATKLKKQPPWTEEKWWELTLEVVESIKRLASTPDALYDYIAPILDKLRSVTLEIMPEPVSFWEAPSPEQDFTEGGMPQVPGSEEERLAIFRREELHRLGAIIQSVLLETQQNKDLFYYQEETHSILLSGIHTIDIAAVRHWGYLHALNLTKGIRFQPVSFLYIPQQEDRIVELKRHICVEANRCDVEEINKFFLSVAYYYKNGTPFDKASLLDQCEDLRAHCTEIANSPYTQLEKTIFVTKMLGTLSLCCPKKEWADSTPEGVQEVNDRYLEIIAEVFVNCQETIGFPDICKGMGIDCPIEEPEGSETPQTNTSPVDYRYEKARPYFEALCKCGVLNDDYSYIRKNGILTSWQVAYAAEVIKKHSGLTLKRIGEIFHLRNLSSEADPTRKDFEVVDEIFKEVKKESTSR